MKRTLATCALCLSLLPAPLWAEPAPVDDAQPGEMSEGLDLLGEGARLLFRGLMAEMEPALTEMGQALAEMQPVLTDLARMIGDIRHYHAPEMLPNGDIILRRKTPLPPDAPEDGEIDL